MEFFFKNVKSKEMELKFYALYLKTPVTHKSYLYTGVHFSLDEAFAQARENLHEAGIFDPREGIDLDSWDILTFDEIYNRFSGRHIQKIKEMEGKQLPADDPIVEAAQKKNEGACDTKEDIALKIIHLKSLLMVKIVKDKDLSSLITYKKIFTNNEIKYLQKQILQKKGK